VKKLPLILMIAAVLALPATAVAADGYTNVPGVTQEAAGTPESSAPAAVASAGDSSGSGVLPFTGLQLALMFGAGVALLGTGVALRRTRSHN
jgi:hypothetical protein